MIVLERRVTVMFFLVELLKKGLKRSKKKSSDLNQKKSREIENIKSDIDLNIQEIKRLLDGSSDLTVYRFIVGEEETKVAIVYLLSITEQEIINEHVIKQMLQRWERGKSVTSITLNYLRSTTMFEDVVEAIISGFSVLFLEGSQEAVIYDTKKLPQRDIEDPQLESSLKGAHQGFLEIGIQNIGMLRSYLPCSDLQVIERTIGRRGKTKVWIVYLKDIAYSDILDELVTRIEKIDIDSIINSGELIEYIEDNPFSPFPQLIMTERPDSAVSQLLQGRFVVIVDKSPAAIVAPANFLSYFQSIDDYNTRWIVASFLRLLRFLGFFMAVSLPAFYIAAISFNFEIIPLQLFLTIATSRSRVPFPPLIEALLMEIMLEMMREAGIRLPAPIGQTIGIVGGIIIGQAAVQAGIVSNFMVIVVASTAIASFILPSYDMGTAVRFLRFPLMIVASLFGLVGIVIGLMCLLIHLLSLESLGTPYASPLAPVRFPDLKDTFIRFPLWTMRKRPKSARPIQDIRQGQNRPKGDPS